MRRFQQAVALSLLAVGLAFSASAHAAVRLQKVGDFPNAVHVAGAPGDGERLYVVQQDGVVSVVRGGVARTFVDLRATIQSGGEQGLLSIAFPPDFQTSRLFYVYYTERGGAANVVAELRAPSGDAADPGSLRPVLSIPHPADTTNHNGGQLQFGPGGLLYLAPGDGGRTAATARDNTTLLGKLLRIDPRRTATAAYSVPADNPYVTGGGRPEIWARGLRNPFRFSFDRATGDLILGDVGQSTTEEINIVRAADGGGRAADFGWDVCEGSFLLGRNDRPCTLGGATLPAIDKFASDGYRSIIPGYVVRDPTLPSLVGRLVYGDFFVPQLRSALPTLPRATDDSPLGLTVPGLTSFGEDAGGCVYAAGGGVVYRLVEQDTRVPCAPATGSQPPPAAPAPPPQTPPAPRARPVLPAARAPLLHLIARRQQRVLRLGGVVLHARCARACRITATGTLRVGRATLPLRRTTRSAPADRRVRIVVRLTRRGRSALRRALRDGRHPKIAVTLRAGGSTRRATVRAIR
ncbi:PQQ-dependent sugar dehydrogenase [Conexibacter woesei]|uniref:Glucose/sorbosone dehydrogenase-like protein n=1 Tax=Conexibacter woesei (strain DSM 14684 / CCUG 47730 / CIP 108061 / JCM 11494 / NBRC 100937 / ID131577) TaxID=469383 RepID=D3F9Q1_CONWI|nr:PQQ-dependent sugar dehydrogenase [Conexibacter woesei]ADB51113.1 Glucose/sorbosone dehydrogenase-like protein [Conexibacter woesei DSM 14684]